MGTHLLLPDHESDDLTSYSPTGGCSCKLAPDELHRICEASALSSAQPAGHQNDDAAFARLPNGSWLLSSVDFQNPIVADPVLAGQIAALNALSDIWACGAAPRYAEVILALPQHIGTQARTEMGVGIMNGLAKACSEVGCAILGGHTVLADAPLIGLAVRGLAPRREIKLKSAARPGDVILLTKALGTGVLVAAHQAEALGEAAWQGALAVLSTPNQVGAALGRLGGVHAMTDITGFGLLGHAEEVARASGCRIDIEVAALPVLEGARMAARAGFVPLLAARNLEAVRGSLSWASAPAEEDLLLMADPQTNGPLMLTVSPRSLRRVQAICAAHGQSCALIGRVHARAQEDGAWISIS